MANSKVRIKGGTFTTDTSTFDVTAGGGETRNPTGCVVISSYVTAIDTNTSHVSLSVGVTDFTTVGCHSVNCEDGIVSTADAHSVHQETNIISLTDPGVATVTRSATIAAISGGVRFTPVQSGTAHRMIVMLIFGAACKAFSDDGDGAMAVGETFDVTHGLGVKPNAGIYFQSDNYLDNTADLQLSMGFHVDTGSIVQNCACTRWRSNNTTTFDLGVVRSDRVGTTITNGGAEDSGYELTVNNTTICTYTNRTNANTTVGLIGLLIDFDDVTPFTEVVPTPTTAASDWNYNALSFTPQAAIGAMTQITTVGTYDTSGLAGMFGIFGIDESGADHCISGSNEDQIALGDPTPVTNSKGRQDVKIYGNDDTGSVVFDFTNVTFTADGFDVTAANITSMDSTIRRWPMLFIEAASGGGSVPIYANHINKLMQG